MKLEQDWHIHTFRSKCGKPDNTVPSIVAKLDEAGMRLAGLADHINLPGERDWFTRVVAENRADLDALEPQCKVLVGAEATMLSPFLCALDADLAPSLDFVLIACNHYHLEAVENPPRRTPRAYADHYLDMLEGAIGLGFADAIAHPFLHTKLDAATAADTLRCYNETRLSGILHAAAQAGVAFEINPRQVCQAVEWHRDLVIEARRHGARFTLGSDSHTLSGIGYGPMGSGHLPSALCDTIGLTNADLK